MFTRLLASLFSFSLFFSLSTHADDVGESIDLYKKIIAEAISSSPKIKALDANLKATKNDRNQTIAGYFPTASFFVRSQKDLIDDTNATQLRALGISPTNKSYGLAYTMPLLDRGLWLKSSGLNQKVDLVELKTKKEIKNVHQALNVDLLKYILSEYKQRTLENSLKKAETAAKEAEMSFNLGLKTKVDVLRTKANLVSLKSDLLRGNLEVQNAKTNFLTISGLDLNLLEEFKGLNEDALLRIIETISSTEYNYGNFKTRPRMTNNLRTELLLETEVLKTEEHSITASSWPTLKIEGRYENSEENFELLRHNPDRSHSVALVFTLPLNLGGQAIFQNVQKSYALKKLAAETFQKDRELNAKLDDSKLQIESLYTLRSSLLLNVQQFEELYRLTNSSYKLGKSTLLELLDIQDNHLQTKIKLAETTINLLSAIYQDELITDNL